MSDKLHDPLTAPKTYWSILNHFLNNKKIPAITPLHINGDIIINFSEKADLFNKFLRTNVHGGELLNLFKGYHREL